MAKKGTNFQCQPPPVGSRGGKPFSLRSRAFHFVPGHLGIQVLPSIATTPHPPRVAQPPFVISASYDTYTTRILSIQIAYHRFSSWKSFHFSLEEFSLQLGRVFTLAWKSFHFSLEEFFHFSSDGSG
jgi:hypothetical protein